MVSPTNPLATSMTFQGLGTDEWAIVSSHLPKHSDELLEDPCLKDWVFIEDSQKTVETIDHSKRPQGYLEWILFNRYLQEAVFGPKDFITGSPKSQTHPLYYLITQYLQLGREYLSKTSYEEVLIPFSQDIVLKGLLFGRYDEKGHSMPFDKTAPTCLVLSGSYAPCEAYVMGIVEGYRKEGVQALAVNYLGFGENASLGTPSHANVMASAEAALHFLFKLGLLSHLILVHGFSIGGFPAARLSAKFKTHLVLDRVAISTEAIAYSMLAGHASTVAAKTASLIVAKFAMYGVPFSLEEPLHGLVRTIFVAQENHPVTDEIGAHALVSRLQAEKTLKATDVVLKKIQESHFSSPINTWTVDSKDFAAKFGGHFYAYYGMEQNEEARKAWQQYIHRIFKR